MSFYVREILFISKSLYSKRERKDSKYISANCTVAGPL